MTRTTFPPPTRHGLTIWGLMLFGFVLLHGTFSEPAAAQRALSALPALPALPAPAAAPAPAEAQNPAPAPRPAAPPVPSVPVVPSVPPAPPAASAPGRLLDSVADLQEHMARLSASVRTLAEASPFAYQATGDRTGTPRVESQEVAFSDPSRPGTVQVNLFAGSVTVKGSNRRNVVVRVTHRGRESAFERDADPPPPGMRRLTPSRRGALAVEEQNNRVTVRSASIMLSMDIELEVPARSNLTLRVVNGGSIEVEGVDGDLEVNNVNGPIKLTGVAGSAVADAVNGQVFVTMTRVTADKVMAFSSLNGSVDVTLPRATRANLELRSNSGDVFTDFDVQQTDPPAPPAKSTQRNAPRRVVRQGPGNSTIYGSINGGGPKVEARSFNGNVFIRRGP